MFKKAMATTLALALSLTLLAGCGGSKSSAAPSASADSSKTSGSGSSTPTTTTAAKDSFVWNVGVDTKGWDPGLAGTGDGAHMINNLFEGLMRDAGDGKLEYGMAESYTISEDQKTYTFKLRPNLKWSDGKPFTAKDFEYSWKRVCDPAAASGNVYIMAPYIVGADDYLNGKGTRDAVGVKATDDLTLVVNLNFPVPYFLSLTSFYAYLPVRE
ncbi:MAG: ABC transporter substrate-binding protein, partial [Oscillospiraceae bacterium]